MNVNGLGPGSLDTEFVFQTSRSGGKGGQHVNKVDSKVEIHFSIPTSAILTEDQKNILLKVLSAKLSKTGVIRVLAQSSRSQMENKAIAIEKFYAIIKKALTPAKKRYATKVKKSAKEKRLTSKKKQSENKALRRKIF